MKRRIGFWLGVTCLLSMPALALAQDDDDVDDLLSNSSGGLRTTLLFVGGEAFNNWQETPIGKRACDDNLTLRFKVEFLPTGPNASRYLEFWKGNNCSSTNRKDADEGNDCEQFGYIERLQTQSVQEFDIPLVDVCRDGNVELWFLPVDSLDTNESVNVYGMFTLMLDLNPPDAPANVRAGTGETEIPIEWDKGGTNISMSYLLWDPRPGNAPAEADGGTDDETPECTSPYLVAGETIDLGNLPPQLRRHPVEGDVDSAEVSGTQLGSSYVAMAIVTEDLAGNISPLSNIACVRVTPTDGFWESVDGYEQGCACSVPGARTSPLAALPVAIALFILRIRRKRRS